MSHLISAFWRWGLRNWERSLAHGAEEDTPSLWGSLVAPTFCSSRDHRGWIGLQSCGGFPLASLSSDAVRNSPFWWILQSQTDQRSPEVEALDSFIAPGWLFIHRRFHPGKLPSRFADCLVETFKGTSPHFLKENLMKTVPEEGGEQISYSITKWTALLPTVLLRKEGMSKTAFFVKQPVPRADFRALFWWCFSAASAWR